MNLSDIPSILRLGEFCGRLILEIKKRKKKSKTKPRPRKRKQTKEEELINYLLTHKAEDSLKKLSAEYLVKNRQRLIRKIEKKVLDEL